MPLLSKHFSTSNIQNLATHTAQKMKFSIKVFFSKCNQIRRKLRILSHLLKKFSTENFVQWKKRGRGDVKCLQMSAHSQYIPSPRDEQHGT